SIGDTLNGYTTNYTGVINTGGYANPAIYTAQASLTLNNCWFRYAKTAVQYNYSGSATTFTINHSQFFDCVRGILLGTDGCGGTCPGCTPTLTVKVNNA